MYIIRLDDACEKRDIEKWNRMEKLLDKYGIKPLVGIIPHCEDPMMEKYETDTDFWGRVDSWAAKGWAIAMHGYNHVYGTECGGINPVNKRSEFAGEPLSVQKNKITKGVAIMRGHGIDPQVFFAPSHTFDENTLIVLKECSNIHVISDTIANDVYTKDGFTFVPQQSGSVRSLPFKTVTFCYHPNAMYDKLFSELEVFIQQRQNEFMTFPLASTNRSLGLVDRILERLYFLRRK